MLHPFLKHQLAAAKLKHGEMTPENIGEFLQSVSETYFNFERKEREQRVQQQNDWTPEMAQVEHTIQTLKETIFAVDMTTYKLLFITRACEVIYGYTVEEFMLNHNLWYELILDEDKAIIDANFMQAGTLVQEYRIRRKDGAVRWLETRMEATIDDAGKMIRIDGVTIDITDFKEAHAAIEQNEKKFRSLIENASDAICIGDEQLNIIYTTKAHERMTGFSAAELLGKPVFQFFHPDEVTSIQGIAADVLANPGVPQPIKLRFLKKDGGWIWVQGLVTNMLHEPAVNGVVANFHDVTDTVEKEIALRESNETLRKANDELDRFVYSVSHDLRAPLASVLGAIEYSVLESTEPEMLENLEMMKESILKLDVFILDILDYSRNSRMAVNKKPINLDNLLSELKTNLKFITAGNNKVDIRFRVQDTSPFISDKSRINIILNNLVSNGIRYYNPKATNPFVEVDAVVTEKEAQIIVRDNGIGIDPQYHQKVFDMFFRASSVSNGSGLGLYILKEALGKLNGTMELQSQPGIGSEFRITIPNLNLFG